MSERLRELQARVSRTPFDVEVAIEPARGRREVTIRFRDRAARLLLAEWLSSDDFQDGDGLGFAFQGRGGLGHGQ